MGTRDQLREKFLLLVARRRKTAVCWEWVVATGSFLFVLFTGPINQSMLMERIVNLDGYGEKSDASVAKLETRVRLFTRQDINFHDS